VLGFLQARGLRLGVAGSFPHRSSNVAVCALPPRVCAKSLCEMVRTRTESSLFFPVFVHVH
jgi:hypothetical protein